MSLCVPVYFKKPLQVSTIEQSQQESLETGESQSLGDSFQCTGLGGRQVCQDFGQNLLQFVAKSGCEDLGKGFGVNPARHKLACFALKDLEGHSGFQGALYIHRGQSCWLAFGATLIQEAGNEFERIPPLIGRVGRCELPKLLLAKYLPSRNDGCLLQVKILIKC